MKAHDSRLRTVAAAGFFLVAAGAVAFFGLRATEGQPRDDVRPLPSGFVAPTLPPLEMVPPILDVLSIKGKQVPIPQGLGAGFLCASEGAGCFTHITYTPPGSRLPRSFIDIDYGGAVTRFNVAPQDEAHFATILAETGPLPTETPAPPVLIHGTYVQIYPPLELSRVIVSNTGGVTVLGWVITFNDADGVSRLVVDDNGAVAKVDIKGGHRTLFQSLMSAANIAQ